LKNNSKKNHSSNRYSSEKLNDFNSNKYSCFGCGEQGDIKAYCHNSENKEKAKIKKSERRGKAKKEYIAWQDNEVSSSSSSSEDAEVNLCLKAKEEYKSSSEVQTLPLMLKIIINFLKLSKKLMKKLID